MFGDTDLACRQIFLAINVVVGFTAVLGCGQLPQGEVTAMTFTASGFTLPAEMAYSEAPAVRTAIRTIAHSKDQAITFVRNLVRNAVNDVLEEQGRNAFLPDGVISQILQQLNINIEYDPLQCPTATDKETNNMPISAMKGGCFIIDNSVTSLCMMDMMPNQGQPMPGCTLMPILNVEPIPTRYRTIRGSLRTSNFIMANWSKQMWQSVLNRVSQRLTSGGFRKFFTTAIVTVDS